MSSSPYQPIEKSSSLEQSDSSDDDDDMEPVITGNIGRPIVRVMIPVLLTLMLVCVIVNLACSKDPTKCHQGQIQSMMPDGMLTEHPDQGVSKNIEAAFIIGSIFIVYIASATFILAAVLYFRLTWCLYGYFAIALSLGIAMLTIYLCDIIVVAFNLAMDYITMAIFVWNFDISIILCFSILDSPKSLRQCTLIIFCCMGALSFTLLMPPLSTYVILFFLVLWDLFAVLAPCGPLNWIVQMMRKKDKNNKPMAKMPEVMVYSTMAFFMSSKTDKQEDKAKKRKQDKKKDKKKKREKDRKKNANENSDSSPSEPVTPSGDPKKEHNIGDMRPQLGLGDFVFYSLLIGKTNTSGSSVVTILFVIVTVIFGLISTLLLLFVKRHALPALPISLTLALIVLAVMNFCAEPMGNALNAMQIHI